MTFDPAYPLASVRPAPYNPRRLDSDARDALAESLQTLGMLKPLIVCQDGRLIAGHQRTEQLRALGVETAPAFVLPDISYEDEIRFNQLHNASDLEAGDATVSVPAGMPGAWTTVQPDCIACELRPRNAAKRNEIMRLLAKHGPWGASVSTPSGRVIVSGLYAVASHILGLPLTVRYVADSYADAVLDRFGRQYGEFSYGHLPRTTWTQNLTQMYRMRGASGKGSRTYDRHVLPSITRDMRILDFGAGQMDYVRRLAADGYDIRGVEFYVRKPRSAAVDLRRVHDDIDALLIDVATRGRFDLVICDSVLNSVDRAEVERDVVATLAAFCRPAGTIIFSGRSRDYMDYIEQSTSQQAPRLQSRANVTYFDRDGMTGMYAGGVWRFQKAHTYQQVDTLARMHFGDNFEIRDNGTGRVSRGHLRADSSWAVVATNGDVLPAGTLRDAVSREFDLPLPGGRSYGRSDDALRALELAGVFDRS